MPLDLLIVVVCHTYDRDVVCGAVHQWDHKLRGATATQCSCQPECVGDTVDDKEGVVLVVDSNILDEDDKIVVRSNTSQEEEGSSQTLAVLVKDQYEVDVTKEIDEMDEQSEDVLDVLEEREGA